MVESQNSSASQGSDPDIAKLVATAVAQLATNLDNADWNYLDERRTLEYIEQSCKIAANAYVFPPNTLETSRSVEQMIGDYLTNIWNEGALQGVTAVDAFSVECGRGIITPSGETLNDLMDVLVKVAVIKPAEFMVITFQQQTGGSPSQMLGDD